MEPALIGYLVFGCLSTLLLLLCFHRFLRASTRERKTGGVSNTAREANLPRAVELTTTVLPAFFRGGAPPANTASVSAKLEGAAAAARLLRARVQGGLLFAAASFLIWGLPPIVFGAASLPWPGSSPLVPCKDAIVVAASAALCALRPDEGRAISAGYICAVALSVVMAVAHVALLGWYDGESMALGGSADERWSDSLALTIAASYVAAAVALPLLWRSSPPHERLRRLISPVRAVFAVDGVLNVTYWAMRTAGKAGDGSCSPGRCAVGLLTGVLYLCCATVVLHRRVRGAALAALSRLGATREERNAAVVASLCSMGQLSRAELLPLAEANFRAIRFDRLKREDLASALGSEGGGGLAARTQPCSLGACDAFLSHSWHDPEAPKWAALCSWARRFEAEEGRPPTLWLDRACIDQSRIADSLPCLPVFVAGCEALLVQGVVGELIRPEERIH